MPPFDFDDEHDANEFADDENAYTYDRADGDGDDERENKRQKKLTAEERWTEEIEEAKKKAPAVVKADGRFLGLWHRHIRRYPKSSWLCQSLSLVYSSAGLKWSDMNFALVEKKPKEGSQYDTDALVRGWASPVIDELCKQPGLGSSFLEMNPEEPLAAAVWLRLKEQIQQYMENNAAECKWRKKGLEPFEPLVDANTATNENDKYRRRKDNATALYNKWWTFNRSKNPPLMARMYNMATGAATGTHTPLPALAGAPTPPAGAATAAGREQHTAADGAGQQQHAAGDAAAAAAEEPEAAVEGTAAEERAATVAAEERAATDAAEEPAVTGPEQVEAVGRGGRTRRGRRRT
ncbi:hypothetical protein HXX76_013730 [Chlamydomonas incerta]|uniref:Uncharacterized protein n=1 Tax=Chlamydomonas incerta TaxID=51695 RepID=A0A835SKS7_CHLIN|nr:hypothetical protein HXX76_013730 [Chlamydomonas incerta]|eukprot:KAG2425313.1 hypothetical protein HXX76_013730 [Chlamydomonas incerta]